MTEQAKSSTWQRLKRWTRARAEETLPGWLAPLLGRIPAWIYVVVVLVMLPGVALNQTIGLVGGMVDGYRAFVALVTTGDIPETQFGTKSGQDETNAKLDRVLAILEPQAGAGAANSPADAEAEAKRRQAVEDLIADPAPAAQEATEDIARGDVRQGFEVLKQEARAAAAEALAKWRRLGALAFGVDTAEALIAYESAFRLDPNDFWTAVYLSRVRQRSGDLRGALGAARAAERAANEVRQHYVARWEIGNLLIEAGALAEAGDQIEKSLRIAEKLAKENPTSAQAARDLSVSLERYGDVLARAGRVDVAQQHYLRSLKIREHLAKQKPTVRDAKRDLAISFQKLGDVLVQTGEPLAAQRRYQQSLQVTQQLADDNATSPRAKRDLSISFQKLGDVLIENGDLKAAQQRYLQSLAVAEQLARDNPTSVRAQRDLAVSLNKLGDVLVEAGDLNAAQQRYQRSLAVAERLAINNPDSAEAQRDLWVSLWRLALFEQSGIAWADVVEKMEAMQAAGTLSPRDQPYLEQARANADGAN